uniref:Phosphatase and actin regulator n=1 Tax=Plectus sambesii TaxID=2011161 RepID=A0A914US51_9BILA
MGRVRAERERATDSYFAAQGFSYALLVSASPRTCASTTTADALAVRAKLGPTASVANPAIHERVRRLQRAQMGDALKRKIEQRPDKHKLFTQHILLSDSSVDPLIQEKVERLKKCKLADNLNNKLAHRPGVLELVDKHILHVDVALEDAIKEGRLQFKPTSAGLSKAPFVEVVTTAALGADSAPSSPRIARMEVISTPSFVSGTPPLARLTSKSSKIKKKSQHRSSTPYDNSANAKGKVIKFHEYKGPPPKSLQQLGSQMTAQTMIPQKAPLNRSSSLTNVPSRTVDMNASDAEQNNDSDSSYDLLLHQQQLFLQWQLELRQHNLE